MEAGELMVIIHTTNWKRIIAPDRHGFPRLITLQRETYIIVRKTGYFLFLSYHFAYFQITRIFLMNLFVNPTICVTRKKM